MRTWFTIVKMLVIFMKSFSVLSKGAYTRHANAVMGCIMKSHLSEMWHTKTVNVKWDENQTDSIIADSSISQTVLHGPYGLLTFCGWHGDTVLNVAFLTFWHMSFTFNSNKSATWCKKFFSLLSWRLFTAQHVLGVFPVHHQELNDCSGSLWFYLHIVVIVVLCWWFIWIKCKTPVPKG